MMAKVSDRDQSRLFVPMSEDIEPWRLKPLARIVYGNPFELTVVFMIMVNAVILAVLTFDNVPDDVAHLLVAMDGIIIWLFVAELVARLVSYGTRPWMFFRGGWNVFDFLVIALIPLFSGFTIVLRLLRLVRVVRLFRFLPEFKLLSVSFVKSLKPLASLVILISFFTFLYAMAGVYLFGEGNPEDWANLAVAFATLTIMLTLENFPDVLEATLEVSQLAWLHLVSFMFIVVFTILNVLIGIVINAMDEARAERLETEAEPSEDSAEDYAQRLKALAREAISNDALSANDIDEVVAQLKAIRKN
jgi:voltage-gated sodium channel